MQPVVATTTCAAGVWRRGKVRDLYDLGDRILIVACDRISAFDVVLPTPIPGKGQTLTRLTRFWFDRFAGTVRHHLIEVVGERAPAGFESDLDQLRGRAMVCRKAEVIPLECVVRGYLAGSGWSDYRRDGALGGVRLPSDLPHGARLPEAVFTPATKAATGHDQNITIEQAGDLIGSDTIRRLRARSLELYGAAAEHAAAHGVIIADTKFEWGLCDGDLLLIDEALTPDSSRFWPAEHYTPGQDQPSFDKQFVRNYLQQLYDAGEWNKQPPGPPLPPDVVAGTTARYREAARRLLGG